MQTVLFDANVLFSRVLRDTVVHLQFHGAFQICWTEDIMAELVYRLRRRHPEWNENQVGGVRRRLLEVFGTDSIVGYPARGFAEAVDPHDRHLDAAAEHGRIDYLVTSDKKALVPDPDRTTYEYFHTDEFLVLCDDSMPGVVCSALLTNFSHHVKQAKSRGDTELPNFPERYEKAGVPQFAVRARKHFQRFDMNAIWKSPPTLLP